MKNSNKDIIPTIEHCHQLMNQYSMLDNIKKHSIQVMNVASSLVNSLQKNSEINLNSNLIIGAALLHDITKTQSIQKNEPHHDKSGSNLLKSLGMVSIANIVSEHVKLSDFDENGPLLAKEIVHYADKRVKHDKIVSLDERFTDLLNRYGSISTKQKNLILQNKEILIKVENKIKKHLKDPLEKVIS